MWEAILVIAVMVAISAAVGFGVAYSRAKEQVVDLRRKLIVKDQQVAAMKKAVEAEAHLGETFEKIENITSPAELQRMFNELARATRPR